MNRLLDDTKGKVTQSVLDSHLHYSDVIELLVLSGIDIGCEIVNRR